jgi:cytochrome c oxidase cbb3-type subunit 4
MTMDVNTLRTGLMLVCFAVFICIVAWAWSGSNRSRFHEAARVPLEDDDQSATTLHARSRRR